MCCRAPCYGKSENGLLWQGIPLNWDTMIEMRLRGNDGGRSGKRSGSDERSGGHKTLKIGGKSLATHGSQSTDPMYVEWQNGSRTIKEIQMSVQSLQ